MPIAISRSDELLKENAHLGEADKELEILFGAIKQGELHSRWDIIKQVENFTKKVESILVKLEEEKRKAESLAYKKLQEVDALLALIEGIDSSKIRRDLGALKKSLERDYNRIDQERRLEKRIKRGRRLYGFYLSKARSSKGRNGDILLAGIDIAKRTPKELTDINAIRSLIEQIKTKPTEEEYAILERDILNLIIDLRKDFEEIFLIEVDIDIEESAKLHKVDKLIRLLRKLKINEPVSDLIKLRDKCRLWVSQDETTEENLGALEKKLEEQTTKIIETEKLKSVTFRLIVNPNDPDLHSLYDKIYAKFPGWNTKGAYDPKEDLQEEMRENKWFFVIAKSGKKVIGGVYFGYYLLHKWNGVIGYIGYLAVHLAFKKKGIAKKLEELAEYYIRKATELKLLMNKICT
ncbi:GNAT family N-acetyltransferase [Candidatus Woesearchaeota archaeon]|nr:GNAT family N-acetyltransferase [Candidatus Woesearchaeota archaeon]